MTVETNNHLLNCPKCKTVLPAESYNMASPASCAACGVKLWTAVFPALLRPVARGASPEAVLLNDEASCFYHDGKKAVIACESCGRFLCSLCSIELKGRTLCAGCLQAGKKKGKIRDLTRQRVLHDDVALAIAVLPLLAWPVTLVTAPAAIFWTVRHWKTPGSLTPRTRIRFVLAVLFAALQIAGWAALFVALALD